MKKKLKKQKSSTMLKNDNSKLIKEDYNINSNITVLKYEDEKKNLN